MPQLEVPSWSSSLREAHLLFATSPAAYKSHSARQSHFSNACWRHLSSPPPFCSHRSRQNAASDSSCSTTYSSSSSRTCSSPPKTSATRRDNRLLKASLANARAACVISVNCNLSPGMKRFTHSDVLPSSSSIPSTWKKDISNFVRKAGMGMTVGSPKSKSHTFSAVRNMLWRPPSVRPQVQMQSCAPSSFVASVSKSYQWSPA
mmetsp:Transcript_13645/g.31026  ORF Transcript_13645/g.31026 Transcript_13645/m.31026 type:complete len:204 (+) Transcript_13645:90-701(+)